jgi:hypothetical protein
VKPIHEGELSTVVLAHESRTNRLVAIKITDISKATSSNRRKEELKLSSAENEGLFL